MADKEYILELAADVAAAFVSHNNLAPEALPALIKSIFSAMEESLSEDVSGGGEMPVPAVPLDQSVHDDYLICLEDGRKYKSLKRHLRTSHEMTPKAYTDKWGLPVDYPMVAPNYSKQRSKLAKRTGLGKS
ncbi:MAG: MucR family transcriptional regulator [Robiginitomaculum sp.]|nr:MucR family transcriptional regulator [Robiginitomaculum sp.]